MSKSKTTSMTLCGENGCDPAKPRVRDRIFRTARELFYRHGIRAVGVDAIACAANTNKMSFYRSFSSKDDLVAEYLRDQEREGWEWWDEVMSANAGNPRAQVEALFDGQLKRMCSLESRGCPMANATIELPDDSPARAQIVQYKTEVRKRFRKLAREMRARDPDVLGDALMLLWQGAFLSRLIFPARQGPAQNALRAARTLIDAHTAAEPQPA